MKLYNLYNELILEEKAKHSQLLNENVSYNEINKVIEDKINVNILYQDYEDKPPSKRYIQVYNLSVTKGGNDAIRAYQLSGGSKTTPNSGAWKIFRLDKIVGWYPTNVKWYKPISDYSNKVPKYNINGDKTMSRVINKVNPNNFMSKQDYNKINR